MVLVVGQRDSFLTLVFSCTGTAGHMESNGVPTVK